MAINERPPKITGEEKKQWWLFKKKRAGVVLSKDEVKAIKAGRKKLRKEMREKGLKGKQDFELTAGTLGLYFDKKHGALLPWLLSHWLGAVLGFLAALLLVLFIFSTVQQMRGHYTINMSRNMFREGFTLSDTVGFENPTTQLFANPADEIPCISISQIPMDIDEIDGEHHDVYFAYTYYIRNEGESTVGYDWILNINAETQELSEAAWIVVFEDGQMRIFAKENPETGQEDALPAFGDDTRGYLNLPLQELDPGSDQFEAVVQQGNRTYWRVIPDKFLSDTEIAMGTQEDVEPMEVHKYTVVMYLEGDDKQATDELIGGRLGVEMNFRLVNEEEENQGVLEKFVEKIFDG